jgi:hypothetical protein
MTTELWIFARAVTCFHCGTRHAPNEVTHMIACDGGLWHAICNGCHTLAHLWYVDDSHEPPTSHARIDYTARKRAIRRDS